MDNEALEPRSLAVETDVEIHERNHQPCSQARKAKNGRLRELGLK